MKTSSPRVLMLLAAVLGGLLLALTVQAADHPTTPFVGDWCNRDFNTREVTRVHIYLRGGNVMVHMWGRCHPNECDWGETTASFAPGDKRTLLVKWDQGFATSTQRLTLQPDGSLQLSGERSYRDKRSPRKESGVYEKGLAHDWSDAASGAQATLRLKTP